MISQRTKASIDSIASAALREALSSDFDCAVAVVDSDEISASMAVMLTVSSYDFRMTILLHFTLDDAIRGHFTDSEPEATHTGTNESCIDAICERANIFCGGINRALALHYPHVGMSTPNVLESRCVHHITELNVGHVRHFRINIANKVSMHASLCICAFAEMDFEIGSEAEQPNNGELEMF